MEKAKNIEDVYNVFAPELYITEETKDFYVDLYEHDMKLFVTALSRNQLPNKAFYIAGQSGNGKSSSLNMLTNRYEKELEKYKFLKIAGRKIFLYDDIDIVDIMLVIGNEISSANESLRKKYIDDLQKFEDINDGTLILSENNSDTKNSDLKVAAKISIGATFFSFLKSSADFESGYKINEEIRKDARKLFKLKRSELIELINNLILDYKKINTKALIIIIDDLEKKDNIDKLFLKDMTLLNELNIIKIITMPIHLHRNETFPSADVREFGLKLQDYDGNKTEDNNILENVIKKRLILDYKSIISENAIKLAIQYSGGNLRQLIRLINIASENALAFESKSIDIEEIHKAIETIGRAYSSKVMNMKSFLNEIVNNKTYKDNNQNLINIAKSTKMELIFAYFNGVVWYEINPVIKKALEQYNKTK